MKKHILLIGMPGSGKSTVGQALADRLTVPYIDTDRRIENQYQAPLATIADSISLEEFLNVEYTIVHEVISKNDGPCIIAPGGSIAYHNSLYALIKTTCHSIFLDVPLLEIKRRIGTTPRGIVGTSSNIEELYKERRPLYLSMADLTIKADQPIAAVVDDIISLLY